jgi:hypothetical protein
MTGIKSCVIKAKAYEIYKNESSNTLRRAMIWKHDGYAVKRT